MRASRLLIVGDARGPDLGAADGGEEAGIEGRRGHGQAGDVRAEGGAEAASVDQGVPVRVFDHEGEPAMLHDGAGPGSEDLHADTRVLRP